VYPFRVSYALIQLNNWEKNDRVRPVAPIILKRDTWVKKCRLAIIKVANTGVYAKTLQIIKSFYQNPIECLREFPYVLPDDDVLLLVAVKDNYSRLEHFLKHYREIGVKHFIFIDNGSTDGTIEVILAQNDTSCYKTTAVFSSSHKAGWFNRIAAHYGGDRWYIVVDSDELLAYPDMSRTDIQNLTEKLSKKGLYFIKTAMLDVYTSGLLMDSSKSDEEYLKECVYFDRYDNNASSITSGMRARLFFEKEFFNTKPTVLHFNRFFLTGPHSIVPEKEYLDAPFGGVVMHLKFLPSDRQRYVEIAREGLYSKNSGRYKTVNEKLEEAPVDPMCESSVMFDPDDAWQYLPHIVNLVE